MFNIVAEVVRQAGVYGSLDFSGARISLVLDGVNGGLDFSDPGAGNSLKSLEEGAVQLKVSSATLWNDSLLVYKISVVLHENVLA